MIWQLWVPLHTCLSGHLYTLYLCHIIKIPQTQLPVGIESPRILFVLVTPCSHAPFPDVDSPQDSMIDFTLNMSIIKSNVALIEFRWALQVLGLCLSDAM